MYGILVLYNVVICVDRSAVSIQYSEKGVVRNSTETVQHQARMEQLVKGV